MSDCLILLMRMTRRMSSLLAPSFSKRGSSAEVYFRNSCFLCQWIELDYFLARSLSRMCFHLALVNLKCFLLHQLQSFQIAFSVIRYKMKIFSLLFFQCHYQGQNESGSSYSSRVIRGKMKSGFLRLFQRHQVLLVIKLVRHSQW